MFQDFTDARTLQRELAHAAAHDSLTGLANRATLDECHLRIGANGGARRHEHLLLYVDLDNFKSVNDTGGHAAGDMLLKQVADAIKATVRADDFVARLGGDEFAVILKNRAAEIGEEIARTIVAAVGDLGFELEGETCSDRRQHRRGRDRPDEVLRSTRSWRAPTLPVTRRRPTAAARSSWPAARQCRAPPSWLAHRSEAPDFRQGKATGSGLKRRGRDPACRRRNA